MQNIYIESWLTHFKEKFLLQEIFPNRYCAFFYMLFKYTNFNKNKKIGIIPTGDFAINFSKLFYVSNIYFFDDAEKNIENTYFISSEKLNEMDYIFLLSTKYETDILKKIPTKMKNKVTLLGNFIEKENFQLYINADLQNYQFLKFLIHFKNTYISKLPSMLQKNKQVILVRENYYSDVIDKVNVISNTLQSNVIFETNQIDTPEKGNIIKSRLKDIVTFFLRFKKDEEIIFFIPITMDGYGLTYILKTKFNSIKMISNFTDYIFDLCKYEYRHLLAENHTWSNDYTQSEYYFANELMNKKISDIIIHRHGDIPNSWLYKYKSPNIFFPPYQQRYPLVTHKQSKQNKLVFIGTVHSIEYDSKIYSCIFLEDIFKNFIEAGFEIDLYYSYGYKKHALAYKKYINSDKFTILKGMPLEILLPKINGKYDWGLLLNDLSKDEEGINSNYKYTIPTKLYTYMGINLPILCVSSNEDATVSLIKNNNIGIVLEKDIINKSLYNIININKESIMKSIYTFNLNNNLNKKKNLLSEFTRSYL